MNPQAQFCVDFAAVSATQQEQEDMPPDMDYRFSCRLMSVKIMTPMFVVVVVAAVVVVVVAAAAAAAAAADDCNDGDGNADDEK